jgi:exopolysaccharide biosynthesis polyprenyl glycosylphosphotransferase
MKIRNDFRLVTLLMLGDAAGINIGLLFSYWIRFSSGVFPVVYGVPHVSHYYKVLPVLTLVMLFLMRSDKLYSVRSRLSIVDEFFSIIKSVTVGILLFMAGTFLYREYSFSRGMLLITWLVLVVFIGSWRFFVNRIRFTRRKKTRNLLIIGDGDMVPRLITHISDDPHWDYNVAGVLRIRSSRYEDIGKAAVLGAVKDLSTVISKHNIDEVILTEVDMSRREVMDIIYECEKHMAEVRIVADLLGMVTSQVDMRTIDGVPLLGLKESPLAEGFNRFIKRAMDIIFSVLGIVVLLPFLLIVAALVKAGSPGPVFYLQKRIGEDGRRFAIIKFRTMIQNAEKGTGPVWAQKDDPRRTKIGGFLRSTNIDELPQLINVLKGDMSLVGPRPERPHFVGKFKQDIPRYMARHKIKSGVTGWAQVNGLRGDTSIEERTKYDIYYVENWSLMFDIKILMMSVFAMKNAY